MDLNVCNLDSGGRGPQQDPGRFCSPALHREEEDEEEGEEGSISLYPQLGPDASDLRFSLCLSLCLFSLSLSLALSLSLSLSLSKYTFNKKWCDQQQ